MASDRDFVPELIARAPANYPDQPDQPDGVDDEDEQSLPDLATAAERILKFVGQWGDGRIVTAGGAHLFARDLVVVARHAQREPDGYAVTVADTLCGRYMYAMPVYDRLFNAERTAHLHRYSDARVVELRERPRLTHFTPQETTGPANVGGTICDHDGCTAALPGVPLTDRTDEHREWAELAGWHLSTAVLPPDRCPDHWPSDGEGECEHHDFDGPRERCTCKATDRG